MDLEELRLTHPSLLKAKAESELILSRLRSDMPQYHDISVVVNGSLARGEITSQSDFDAYALHLEGAQAEANQLFIEVRERANLKEFAADGAFGASVVAGALSKNIGGQDDDNRSFTRRMLLLLESVALGNTSVYDQTISTVVGRYISDDITDKQIGRFLLNDFIRFYRTMCVDFEFKTVEQTKPWGIRYAKLIFSRKQIYFSGVLMCAELAGLPADAKREALIKMVKMRPIDRFTSILGATSIPALTEYNNFLGLLDDEAVRDELSKVDMIRASHTDFFKGVKASGHRYSTALVSALRTRYNADHPIHEALAV